MYYKIFNYDLNINTKAILINCLLSLLRRFNFIYMDLLLI